MLEQPVRIVRQVETDFSILKSDNLVIGGYASIEVVDKQNDLITLKALNEAVEKFMEDKKFRNVMSNHSNVQVGEVIESYRDTNGTIHKTHVDDVGFYVVIKLRDDIEKAKEISRGIRKGTLRSFSIGGQALSKQKRNNDEFGEYNEIDKLELHEVTICEKGINPEAKFDILKQEKGEKMTEKLEKALEELNTLMKEVDALSKEEMDEKAMMDAKAMDEKAMYDKAMGEEETDKEEMTEKEEMEEMDMAAKALDEDSTRDYEAGEEVVSGGRPTAAPAQLGPISKGLESGDFTTLDLSVENVEKAYEQFKAEQLEKLAYDSLSKQFESRFAREMEMKKSLAERAEYDAHAEVSALKEEFAELRKSLTERNDAIVKAAVPSLPEDVLKSVENIADMSWDDIHKLAGNY